MRKNKKTVNLFKDKDIYNIKHIISISCEDDLNQFWEFLSNLNTGEQEIIQTFLSQFYSIALSYILKKESYFFEIILEDSQKYFYVTVFNKKASSLFKKYAKKASLDFINSENRISVKLDKSAFDKTIKKIHTKNKKREKNLINSVDETKPKAQKAVYTFLNESDLEELLHQSDDMIKFMPKTSQHSFNEHIFISLRSTLSLFCQTLRYYDRIVPFATTLTKFSNLLNVNKEKFLQLNNYQIDLLKGFVNNINHWLHVLFVYGGADLYFMDNSMNADYEMISLMINPLEYKTQEADLDSIFDF